MKKASDYLSDDQQTAIEKAIVEAEASTSCEIVPTLASSSGRYDRPEDIIGVWFATLSTIVLWLMYPHNSSDTGNWSTLPEYVGILILVVTLVASFIVGAMLGSQVDWLRRLFTPKQEMIDSVAAKAREVFFDKRVHHTAGGTGLLIYVSAYEHIAVVLADQEILDHPELGQSFVNNLCQHLTNELKKGDVSEAICSTIKQAGQQLASPLPRAEDDVNELQDVLVLVD